MPEPTQKQSVLGHIKDNWKKYALGAAAGSIGTLGTLKYKVNKLDDEGYTVAIIKKPKAEPSQ